MHQHDRLIVCGAQRSLACPPARLLPTMAYCLPAYYTACLSACRVNKTQTFERAAPPMEAAPGQLDKYATADWFTTL